MGIGGAESEGWLSTGDDKIQFWNTTAGAFKYVCEGTGIGYSASCTTTELHSFEGYFISSNVDNLTIIRQN